MSTETHTQPLVLTQEQAAARLGVTKRAMANWRSMGRGPKFVKLGKVVAYRPSDLSEFVNANIKSHTGQQV